MPARRRVDRSLVIDPDAMNPALIALAIVLCIAAAVLVAVGATWLLGTFLEWRRFHGR